jgi:hypothetical protein
MKRHIPDLSFAFCWDRLRARAPLLLVAGCVGSALPSTANASGSGTDSSSSATARAEALSYEASKLRDGGKVADACSKFAESKRLAPGVGVSLNLADCFERLGRTTSAWSEYQSAEKLARDRHDERAETAHSHVQALAARLSHLTIAVSPATAGTLSEIRLDREPVPPEAYNVSLEADPGDHRVSVVPKRGPARTLEVHLEPGAPGVTVHAEDARSRADTPVAAAAAPIGASDPAPAASSPADALFEEGKSLLKSGQTEQACAKFAQSQALASGVGITLHLADCYEHLGRTASAWTEFVLAERAAHEQSDRRESTAHARALALEPRLERVTIAVPASTPQDGALVQLDGRTVPASMWNVAMVIDPGDHLVSFEATGGQRRTFPLQVDASHPSVTVQVGNHDAPAESPAPPMPLSSSDSAPASEHGLSTRNWVEIGLLGGAVVAAGVGAGLLVVKNDSMTAGAIDGRPYVDPVAAAASKIVFAAAGAAAATAIVLYLTAPRAKDAGLTLSPSPMVGGAGASLHGTF